MPEGGAGAPASDLHDVAVRKAVQADVRDLGRLAVILVGAHHDFDARRFIPVTPRTESSYGAYLRSQLEEPDAVVLVAARMGAVVGYCYAGVEGFDYMALRGPAGALYDIVVDPAHRGRGIGRVLLDAALRVLEERGVPRVVLSTATQNLAAQRLFARAGFRPTMIEMTRESGEPGD